MDIEGSLWLGNRGIKNIIKDIIEYIIVERVSCLRNWGFRILLKIF